MLIIEKQMKVEIMLSVIGYKERDVYCFLWKLDVNI